MLTWHHPFARAFTFSRCQLDSWTFFIFAEQKVESHEACEESRGRKASTAMPPPLLLRPSPHGLLRSLPLVRAVYGGGADAATIHYAHHAAPSTLFSDGAAAAAAAAPGAAASRPNFAVSLRRRLTLPD